MTKCSICSFEFHRLRCTGCGTPIGEQIEEGKEWRSVENDPPEDNTILVGISLGATPAVCVYYAKGKVFETQPLCDEIRCTQWYPLPGMCLNP